MSRYILKMSLLFPLRDTWNSLKNDKLPLVQSVPNPYQYCTIVMRSALFERKKEHKKELFGKGWHRTDAAMRHIQYLDRVDRHSGRFHISYYAAINECTLRKVKRPTHWWIRTHINTDAPMQRLACTQSAERSTRTSCVCVRKKIFEEDILPVAMEHSWRETYTHLHIIRYQS